MLVIDGGEVSSVYRVIACLGMILKRKKEADDSFCL